MDNYNFKNMILAYNAVHDNVLRESMEELGFFDDLSEGLGGAKDPNRQKSRDEEEGRIRSDFIERLKRGETPEQRQETADEAEEFLRTHPRRRRTQREQADLYDIILSHLLDEGYADCLGSAEIILENMSEEWIYDIVEERAEGVKPYRPGPTQRQITRQTGRAEQRRRQKTAGQPGYGPEEKFYKPEDNRIPDEDTADWFRNTKKTFGRPTGKYDPKTIITQDIINRMPENSPGARPKPRRVIPSRLDRKPRG